MHHHTRRDMFDHRSFFVDELFIISSLSKFPFVPSKWEPIIEIYNAQETRFFEIPSVELLDYSNGYSVVYVKNSIR